MRLPEIRIKYQEPALLRGRLRIKNYFGYFLLVVIFFISLSRFPQKVLADFAGGINIGDHYNEFVQAAQASGGNGWVYVMMKPGDGGKLVEWQNQFPNIKIIVRGHYPDRGGDSLTADYAKEWALKLKDLPRPVYFVPVNEPNNPSESATGISASKVREYTDNLIRELNALNLLSGSSKKVILLSPAIDIFTLADQGPQYITDLGGWSFFQKFEGICLNLYGQFDANKIDPNAPLIKQGQGYREFLKSHFGADEVQSQSMKIYACETGVIKLQDTKVKYKENAAEIVTYLNLMKTVWGGDPNFVMFAIFSYDPANYSAPSWIYSEKLVLQTMGLTGGTTITVTPVSLSDFSSEYDIAENANKYLLPKSIQDAKKAEEGKCVGIQVGKNCLIDLSGILAFFKGDKSGKKNLATETDYLQSYSVTKDKKVNIEKGAEVREKVPQQVIKEETGAFNMYRPNSIDYKQVASAKGGLAFDNHEQNVLGAAKTPEGEVKNGFFNTLSMLLPFSMRSELTKPVEITPPPAVYPSPTPDLGSPTPTVVPGEPTPVPPVPTVFPRPACSEGHDYCSVSYLLSYFPQEAIARIASKICQRESGSDPFAANRGCQTGLSVDYSIGLFQINLLAHCAADAFTYTWDPPSCTIIDTKEAHDTVDRCEQSLLNPDTNIQWTVEMSSNGTNWNPWRSDIGCNPF